MSIEGGGEYYVSHAMHSIIDLVHTQVVWDNDEPSWVSHEDFQTYTGQDVINTVEGLKLKGMIKKRIGVDWRNGLNFQYGAYA